MVTTKPRETTAAPTPRAQWTKLLDGSEPLAPAPRSGHALTLLTPTRSILLFGGSNGADYFGDVHVLEPVDYAAREPTPSGRQAKQKAKAKMRRVSGETRPSQESQPLSQSQHVGGRADQPTLVWKKLVVSTIHPQGDDADFLASSFGSDVSSESPHRPVVVTAGGSHSKAAARPPDPQLGRGRDYHTMHYVPSSPADERKLGFRVLVVGNILVSNDEEDVARGQSTSQPPPMYDTNEMRVDEVRVKQPQLTAQWVSRSVKSMWKPHARNGHCSALLGDQLFCFGGKDAEAKVFYNDFFYFDVGLNQWREQATSGKTPSPRAFADMTVSTSREQLFVMGGNDYKAQFGGVYMYDVQNCRWDKLLSLGDKPEARLNHTLTQVSPDHLVLFGGKKRASRRNDLYLYDIATMTWKQLGAQTSRRREKIVGSETASQHSVLSQSSVSSASSTTPVPSSRTAHSAVLYDTSSDHDSAQSTKKIIVFGGYAGSHTWLNDLHILDVEPATLGIKGQPVQGDLSSSSRETTATHTHSSQSHSSISTARSSSQSSIEGALVDITNTTTVNIAVAKPVPFTSTYTPAAVAARRRRLAELETKRDSPTKQKKQRSRDSISETSASQIQNQSPPRSQDRVRTVPTPQSTSPLSAADAIGLQTTMFQLLQYQQRVDSNITRLTSIVREGQSLAHRDAFTTHQVFMQKQNETLENKLEAMTKRYEAAEEKVKVLEQDKQKLQEQLAATETEVYVYKKNIEETMPQLSTQLFEAVEKAASGQTNAVHLMEAKISSIHDILEEMRHFHGERTETDDSPPKLSSIFADDSYTQNPSAEYPQTVVHELEKKLNEALQDNAALQQRVAQLEDKVKRAEGNAQRIRELSIAMMGSQNQEEETKGE